MFFPENGKWMNLNGWFGDSPVLGNLHIFDLYGPGYIFLILQWLIFDDFPMGMMWRIDSFPSIIPFNDRVGFIGMPLLDFYNSPKHWLLDSYFPPRYDIYIYLYKCIIPHNPPPAGLFCTAPARKRERRSVRCSGLLKGARRGFLDGRGSVLETRVGWINVD